MHQMCQNEIVEIWKLCSGVFLSIKILLFNLLKFWKSGNPGKLCFENCRVAFGVALLTSNEAGSQRNVELRNGVKIGVASQKYLNSV